MCFASVVLVVCVCSSLFVAVLCVHRCLWWFCVFIVVFCGGSVCSSLFVVVRVDFVLVELLAMW